jgi:hypothetical protein
VTRHILITGLLIAASLIARNLAFPVNSFTFPPDATLAGKV